MNQEKASNRKDIVNKSPGDQESLRPQEPLRPQESLRPQVSLRPKESLRPQLETPCDELGSWSSPPWFLGAVCSPESLGDTSRSVPLGRVRFGCCQGLCVTGNPANLSVFRAQAMLPQPQDRGRKEEHPASDIFACRLVWGWRRMPSRRLATVLPAVEICGWCGAPGPSHSS